MKTGSVFGNSRKSERFAWPSARGRSAVGVERLDLTPRAAA